MLTTGHVIGAGGVEVYRDGKWVPATIKNKPTGDRVSLIQASGVGWPAAKIYGDVNFKKDLVTVVGYPSGRLTQTQMYVTSLGSRVSGDASSSPLTGLGHTIGGGTSGGGVFTSSNELCGIIVLSRITGSPGGPRGPPVTLVRGTVGLETKSYAHAQSEVFALAQGLPPKPHLRAWVLPSGCDPCEASKADVRAGKFSGYDVEITDITTKAGRKQYDDTKAAIIKAGGKINPRSEGVPAFHLAGKAAMTFGYGKRSGFFTLTSWIVDTIKLLPRMATSIVSNDIESAPLPPAPEPEPYKKSPLPGWEPPATREKAPIAIPKVDAGKIQPDVPVAEDDSTTEGEELTIFEALMVLIGGIATRTLAKKEGVV